MKKTLSVVLTILLLLSMLILTACTNSNAVVESVLVIDEGYVGHREITVKYPLNISIDSLSKQLLDSNPLKDSESSKFEYLGVEQDGYIFVMDIVFDSHSDYLSQMSALVGREVSSAMSQPESVLCTGTRMKEDFDVADIIGWMTKLSKSNEDTKDVEYNYSVNTVSINGTVFNTSSTVDISQRDGKPINSIIIETTNLKDGTYDRTITFSIPNKTYVDLAGSIEPYFASLTSENAQYCGWTSLGTSWEYKVIFKSISLDELSQYTSMLLDTNEDTVFYTDKDNSSTPLSEGLVFEESFNTFSFMNSKGEDVSLEYRYALPTKTTRGDGTVFMDGKWNTVGTWQEGVYSVSLELDMMNIRIPDGIQYAINGINMKLEVKAKDSFVRTTDFLYSKTQGMDGMLYARDFFENKGATVELTEDDDNLICRVICEGSAQQITDQLVSYFGSGNFMAYEVKNSSMALSAKTKLTDYINLAYMLNSTNANRPITYSAFSSSDENIVELMCGDTSTKSSKDTKVLKIEVPRGQGTVVYNGKIPNTSNIILYSVIGSLMLCITVAGIIYMLHRKRKKKAVDTQALQQDADVSLSELDELSDEVSKELRDQIDKDIEEKIEADRIETLTKELKAKEIAELEKKIYGDNEETEEQTESVEESQEDSQEE